MAEETKPPEPSEIMTAVRRIEAGEHELFWQLVEPFQRSIQSTAHSLLRNADDAAEVVQETNLKALRNLGQLRDGDSLKYWLVSIAINEARMLLRKRREEPLPEDEDSADRTFSPRHFSRWRDTPLAELERKEVRDAVRRAMHQLSPLLREVFALRDIQHFSVGETAAALGIAESKVSVRLHRARLRLRELLAPLLRDPSSPWVPLRMMIEMPARMMHRVVRCKTAIGEISNYIDGSLAPDMRDKIEEHMKYCTRCSILLDTTRKTLFLVADEQVFLPSIPYKKSIESRFSSD